MVVLSSGTYTIVSSSNVDTYGYIYSNSFDPSNVGLNLITQDDDSGGNVQFRLSVFLQAGTTYILVATTYSPGVTAPFTIIASGPNRIGLNRTSTTTTTTTMQPIITNTTMSKCIRLSFMKLILI